MDAYHGSYQPGFYICFNEKVDINCSLLSYDKWVFVF